MTKNVMRVYVVSSLEMIGLTQKIHGVFRKEDDANDEALSLKYASSVWEFDLK